MCVIVNEANEVVGSAPRDITVKNRLLGRVVFTLVFATTDESSQRKLYIQKRSANKDVYPGHFDVVCSGIVCVGEDYADTAAREMHEELGVALEEATAGLEHIRNFRYSDKYCDIWGGLFTWHGTASAVTKLQASEVESGAFIEFDQVQSMLRTENFTPVGRHVLELYMQHLGNTPRH